MVESIANIFLETLSDLLVEEIRSLRGVGGEVEQVERELKSIHGLLKKADREKRDSATVEDCLVQLKGLAIKAENVLERYAVEVKSKKEGRRVKEKFQRYICILCEWASVHELGGEARDIVSRFADLRQRLESDLGQQSSSQSRHEDERQRLLRQTYAYEVERCFVGMDKDIENLVSMVKDDDGTRVIKIYGLGGLGKTTLARKIYNYVEFESYARAWVCITQQLQPHAALSTILKTLDRDGEAKTNEMDVAELLRRIHQILEEEGTKCLIVIDDIWENKDWEIIRPAFPINSNSNCNVLITTRNINIANHECRNYKLGLLTQDQGWDLLQKIALAPPADERSLKTLEKIGREIVVKCGRLPFYITLMGGILRQEQAEYWNKVNTNMDSYLRHGGDGVTEEGKVEEVLGLSYDSLPYYLKPCFLYLACFREDEEIDTERLYLLWMAEGLVSHQDRESNETLRDVAQRYLTELVMRCMVQVDDTVSLHNNFSSCRLHDLMHKLCSSKVDEGEKFLERVDFFSGNLNSPSFSTSTDRSARPSSIGNSSSRLVINVDKCTDDGFSIEGLEKVKNLRCLVHFRKPRYSEERTLFEDSMIDLGKSPCLRTLVLDRCKFKGRELPRKVRKLIHLRYLSLRNTNVKELPVWCMPYLHTLDLRRDPNHGNNIRVPNVIWKMKRLRHLFLTRGMIELIGGEKLRLDGLLELETLDDISSEIACVAADIPKLISLRKLDIEIYDLESMSVVARHMSTGNNRLRETNFYVKSYDDEQKIDLSWEMGRDAIKNVLMSPSLVTLGFIGCIFGDGFQYYEEGMTCKNLVRLYLKDCKFGGDVMEELGKYPVLQTLFMNRMDFGTTETLIFPSNSFPQLNVLNMLDLSNVRELQVEETAMPKLRLFRATSSIDGESIETRVPREFLSRVRRQATRSGEPPALRTQLMELQEVILFEWISQVK